MRLLARGTVSRRIEGNLVVKACAFARVGGYAACTALLLSWAGFGLSPADAADSRAPAAKVSAPVAAAKAAAAKATAAKAAANTAYTSGKGPETTSSVDTADVDPNCLRSRKRLWVEGEGWVVRRVTTCF